MDATTELLLTTLKGRRAQKQAEASAAQAEADRLTVTIETIEGMQPRHANPGRKHRAGNPKAASRQRESRILQEILPYMRQHPRQRVTAIAVGTKKKGSSVRFALLKAKEEGVHGVKQHSDGTWSAIAVSVDQAPLPTPSTAPIAPIAPTAATTPEIDVDSLPPQKRRIVNFVNSHPGWYTPKRLSEESKVNINTVHSWLREDRNSPNPLMERDGANYRRHPQ